MSRGFFDIVGDATAGAIVGGIVGAVICTITGDSSLPFVLFGMASGAVIWALDCD